MTATAQAIAVVGAFVLGYHVGRLAGEPEVTTHETPVPVDYDDDEEDDDEWTHA